MSNDIESQLKQLKQTLESIQNRVKQLEVHLGVYKIRTEEVSSSRDDSYFHGDDHFKS